MKPFQITKIRADTKEVIDDLLVQEVPLTISVGDKELVTLLCTPEDLKDLVRGFLFTAGFIKKANNIKKIILNQERWTAQVTLNNDTQREDLIFRRLYTPGCGKGILFYNAFDFMHKDKNVSHYTVRRSHISALLTDFKKRSLIYLKTGGVHSAAIADDKSIVVFKEDIGRHNAIDKVIGKMLLENDSFEDRIVITSGRISSDVILKIQKCKIPIVISMSAPTDQAVRHARQMRITLIGFARGNRMNIYSEEQRIIISE